MNRTWLGAGILVLLLIAGLAVQKEMDRAHIPASEKLSLAETAALRGDWETAHSLAQEAKAMWDAAQQLTAAVADHSAMEEVDMLFREMQTYAASGDREHFAACCARLSRLTRAVGEAHRLTLQNLL